MSVSKNLRRDIRKAQRSDLAVDQTTDPALGPTLFRLYETAVKHHGGSLRYNAGYFRGLLELAGTNSRIRVYTALNDAEIGGFAVVVRHGDIAYYLHGGSRKDLRRLSPSDLILAEAIDDARSAGCNVFNFMASPADQPTLVRYKEKWGGETRELETYTLPASATYPLFRIAESIYRRLN
jgi:hypothetical protein